MSGLSTHILDTSTGRPASNSNAVKKPWMIGSSRASSVAAVITARSL